MYHSVLPTYRILEDVRFVSVHHCQSTNATRALAVDGCLMGGTLGPKKFAQKYQSGIPQTPNQSWWC